MAAGVKPKPPGAPSPGPAALHPSAPPAWDAGSPHAVYLDLQARYLAEHGVRASVRFVDTAAPRRRVHVITAPSDAAAGVAGAGAKTAKKPRPRAAGNGNLPVVFVMGGGAIAAYWAPLLARLQDSHVCIAPDRPGLGLTDTLDYRTMPPASMRGHAVGFMDSVLDALGIERAHLVGNSIGGTFCAAFAIDRPHRVGRVAFVGAPAGIHLAVPWGIRIMGVRGVNTFIAGTVGRPSEATSRRVFSGRILTHPERQSATLYRLSAAAQSLPGARRSWFSLLEATTTLRGARKEFHVEADLPNLRAPCLFVWGEKDLFAPAAAGRAAARLIPDARFELVRDAGHMPWLDQPEECARLLTEFLD